MNCRVVKVVCIVLAGFALSTGWVLTAGAETLLEQPGSGSNGAYEGAYWKLFDSGFDLTGDSLTQTLLLQSVTFMHGSSRVGTNDLEYLKVFTGDTGGLGTFVGISTNSVDAYWMSEGDLMTWTFNNVSLDKDTTYSFVFGATNDSSNPSDTVRLSIVGTDPLLTCRLISGDTASEPGFDPYLRVSLVPEPSTLVLLVMGLLCYAWKKQK